jgi:3-oxoacyl-[acyl-carrier protein] reductase
MPMHIDLSGKTACVTGAATGIGRSIAKVLSECGATVAINHCRQNEQAMQLASELQESGGTVRVYDADVSNGGAVFGMVSQIERELGAIDILVNNAGILMEKPFLELSEADWDRVIAVDLKSVFLCSQAVLHGMATRQSGCLINIASELGYLGRAEFGAYCAAKAGVVGLTKSLAREFAPAVRVNGIAPGPTETALLSLEMISPELRAKEVDIPAQRAAHPEEIAATAAFLASDHARFYYGQMLSPNGGALML